MNSSVASSHLRQYDVPSVIDFTPGYVTTKKGDGLAMIFIIVAIFVILAVIIIVTVHYGPQLHKAQITLYHEPLPQDMDNGVRLTNWKKLGSQKSCSVQSALTLENNNATGLNVTYGTAKPTIIEITSL
uniref:Uncharacterized protein n=1 Tax=Anolis carolinensis TaxID=28377 RepID=A0A803TD80_ANOCA